MSISRKPYLIRAMHEWICDSHLTPHIVVDISVEGVQVPREHASDGKIILNISESATEGLRLGNDIISFATRFGGRVNSVSVPAHSVLGIYARETGEGMIFTGDEADPDRGPDDDGGAPQRPDRPALKVVK